MILKYPKLRLSDSVVLERFPAKHALGLDPGVEAGSRQENASNQESRAPFRFYRNGKGSKCPGPMPWSAASWAVFPLSDREVGRLRCRWCSTMPKPFVTSMARLVGAIVLARPEVYAFPRVPARLKAHAFPRRDDRLRTTR